MNYRNRIDKLLSKYEFASSTVKEEKKKLAEAQDHSAAVETAQQVAQEVAARVQEKAHKQITAIVSKCLSSIFEDPYEFKINFERKRGKTEARLVFIKNGFERKPLRQTGGGVCDVAAFAMRLADVILSKPSCRRLIVLDEPFKNLQPMELYGPKIEALLQTLSEDLDVQIIMISHQGGLRVGKVIDMENK